MDNVQQPTTSVKHLANLGDQIASLPACKRFYEATGRKIKYLQRINVPGAYYPGAVHPTTHDGVQVTMNQAMFDMMKPLMESQEYIDSYEVYSGQHVDLDFDVIRSKTFVNMPHGMIQSWLFYAFPDLACNLSQPWLSLPERENDQIAEYVKDKVIINFTERYRNQIIDYFFLKRYAPALIFAGNEKEHFQFCNQWGLRIPRLEVDNFLELAYAIKNCRFVLANQSFSWNIAFALGTPKILEVCQYAVNCEPFLHEDSYGFYHQGGLEVAFQILFNKTHRL